MRSQHFPTLDHVNKSQATSVRWLPVLKRPSSPSLPCAPLSEELRLRSSILGVQETAATSSSACKQKLPASWRCSTTGAPALDRMPLAGVLIRRSPHLLGSTRGLYLRHLTKPSVAHQLVGPDCAGNTLCVRASWFIFVLFKSQGASHVSRCLVRLWRGSGGEGGVEWSGVGRNGACVSEAAK